MGLGVPNCELFGGRSKYDKPVLVGQEVFSTLLEVQVLTEPYRQTYNRIRPHSSSGYQPRHRMPCCPQYPLRVLVGIT